jgi:hypothetical protein
LLEANNPALGETTARHFQKKSAMLSSIVRHSRTGAQDSCRMSDASKTGFVLTASTLYLFLLATFRFRRRDYDALTGRRVVAGSRGRVI